MAWEVKKLGEVCIFKQGVQVPVKLQNENQKKGQIRFLRIIDFTQGNVSPRFIDFPGEEHLINEDDVALVRYGASTGFVCRGLSGVLANNLFRIIPKSEKILLKNYLFEYLNSSIFQKKIKDVVNGVAMPAISFGLVKNMSILLPSIEEQKLIVSKLDNISEQIKQLENIYSQKLSCLEELKQSILQKAFKGELIEVSA